LKILSTELSLNMQKHSTASYYSQSIATFISEAILGVWTAHIVKR